MSKKSAPRRPHGQSGPAQSSGAREALGTHVDPAQSELLQSFLGPSHVAEERESGIPVCLKLLRKTSEATKLKSLRDLIPRVNEVTDEQLVPHVSALLDVVRTHVDFDSIAVRREVFLLLEAVVTKGKAVKQLIAATLNSLLGCWLTGMHDMAAEVRLAAVGAFERCFPPEKRPVVLEKFAADAAAFLIDRLLAVASGSSKPLLDDTTDPKANVVFSGMSALSTLMREAPTTHRQVLDFVTDAAATKAFLPPLPLPKQTLLQRTPRARAAAVTLVHRVVDCCPMPEKRHQWVAGVVGAGVGDMDSRVAEAVWELMCAWVKRYPVESVSHFPSGFLDRVVDVLVSCEVPETLQVICAHLLRFVGSVTKERPVPPASCSSRGGGPRGNVKDVLDEFCAAVVEKISRLSETPNTAASEMTALWTAALDLWELMCARSSLRVESDVQGGYAVSECLELFAVLMRNVVEVEQHPRRAQRFMRPIAHAVSAALRRVTQRDERLLSPLLATLTHDVAHLSFAAIPVRADDGDEKPLTEEELQTLRRHLRTVACRVLSQWMSAIPLDANLDTSPSPIVHAGLQCMRDALRDRHWEAVLLFQDIPSTVYTTTVGARTASELIDAVCAVAESRRCIAIDASDAGMPAAGGPAEAAWLSLLHTAVALGDARCKRRLFDALANDPSSVVRSVVREGISGDAEHLADSCINLLLSTRPSVSKHDLLDAARSLHLSGSNDAEASLLHTAQRLGSAVTQAVTQFLVALGGNFTTDPVPGEADATARATTSEGETASSTDDDSCSDASSSASDGDDDDRQDTAAVNRGNEFRNDLESWIELLHPAHSSLCAVLRWRGPDAVALGVLRNLVDACTLLAPRIHTDQFVSDRLVRMALHSQADADTATANLVEGGAPQLHGATALPLADVLLSLSCKKHWVSTEDMLQLQAQVRELLDAYEVPSDVRKLWARDSIVLALRTVGPLGAGSNLSWFLTPCEPDDAVDVVLALSETLLSASALRWRESPDGPLTNTFAGGAPLALVEADVTRAIRSAQTVKLLQATVFGDGRNDRGAGRLTNDNVSQLWLPLLECSRCASAYSEPVSFALFQRLLCPLLHRVLQWSRSEPSEGAKALVARTMESGLLPTTGYAVVRMLHDTRGAMEDDVIAAFLRMWLSLSVSLALQFRVWKSSSSSVSAAQTQGALVETEMQQVRHLSVFIEHCEAAARWIQDDVLHSPDPAAAAVLDELAVDILRQETSLASMHPDVLCLALKLLALDDRKKALPDATVKSIQKVCDRAPLAKTPRGLGVLAVLMGSRVPRAVLPGLCAQTLAAIAASFPLHHLPSNGRLGQRPPTSPALPLAALQSVQKSCAQVLDALRLHDFHDDALRSSVHLVVFDVICEAATRLQPSKLAAMSVVELASVVALSSAAAKVVQTLSSKDVHVLRASEASVRVTADCFCFVHRWVASVPLTRLESVGVDEVRVLVTSVCWMAHLTLMNLAIPLPDSVVQWVVRKPAAKGLRKQLSDYSSVQPLRLAAFRHYYQLLQRTHKQKLLFQTTLLGWACVLSNETSTRKFLAEVDPKEHRALVFGIADQITALAFAPAHATTRTKWRLEDSLLCTPRVEHDSFGFETEVLAAPTNVDLFANMCNLARGGMSVFSLLLQSSSLGTVKDWLETVDKKLREHVCRFVEDHLSPVLIQQSLASVLEHSPDGSHEFSPHDNLTVVVRSAERCIDVTFQVDEISVTLKLSLPKSFPMRPATVAQDLQSSRRGASATSQVQGVSAEKWRSWLLKITALLFGGSCDLWRCIELFEENLKRHFEGVEPCPICYAVVSATNNKLPDMKCAVCRNSLFHSSCLFTWWGNTGQTSCPMCRSPWVSV